MLKLSIVEERYEKINRKKLLHMLMSSGRESRRYQIFVTNNKPYITSKKTTSIAKYVTAQYPAVYYSLFQNHNSFLKRKHL